MQPELAVDRLELGRLDQLAMRHLHRMQRPFELLLPERQEALQLGKFRKQIVGLPDIRLQQPMVIGPPIQNVGCCQPITATWRRKSFETKSFATMASSVRVEP
jgi:hypothetical protein